MAKKSNSHVTKKRINENDIRFNLKKSDILYIRIRKNNDLHT